MKYLHSCTRHTLLLVCAVGYQVQSLAIALWSPATERSSDPAPARSFLKLQTVCPHDEPYIQRAHPPQVSDVLPQEPREDADVPRALAGPRRELLISESAALLPPSGVSAVSARLPFLRVLVGWTSSKELLFSGASCGLHSQPRLRSHIPRRPTFPRASP